MRVLLVEDNARLSTFINKGLLTEGFSVDFFGTVSEAEAALQTVKYNVVILDLGLPDGDGLELLRSLRGQGDNIPVLILTARDGVDDRVKGLNSGGDDYMLKPFAMEELVAELGAAFLCADLCITSEPRPDHAAYINSWLEVLKNDRKAIFVAASRASHAAEFLTRLTGREK